MPPIEICYDKDQYMIEAGQSFNFHFTIRGNLDEKTLIHGEGEDKGGNITIAQRGNRTNFYIEPKEVRTIYRYHGKKLTVKGI